MIRITPSFFYEIGSLLHPLTTVAAGQDIATLSWSILYPAQQRLSGLLLQKIIPVKVCTESGWKLHGIIGNLLAKQTGNVEPVDAYVLNDGVRQFEAVLSAELSQMDTYFVSQKGCYSTNDLIAQADIMFPASVRELMTPESIIDIRQAGRCLAFELPTASAFHFLRAAESVLHKYYDVISGGKARPRSRNMGKYIEALEKIRGVNEKVLGVLRQVKNLHRNPIMHPEAVLDMEEAMTLCGIVQSAITTMISFVKKDTNVKENEKTPAPPPPVIPTLAST